MTRHFPKISYAEVTEGLTVTPSQSDIDRGDAQPHEEGRYTLRYLNTSTGSNMWVANFATRDDLLTAVSRIRPHVSLDPISRSFSMQHCPLPDGPHWTDQEECIADDCCTKMREFLTITVRFTQADCE